MLKNDLKKKADGYIKEYACEQTWNALTPDKKQQLAAPTTNAEEEVKEYVAAVAEKFKSTLVGQYIIWYNFTNGIADKAQQLLSQGHLTAPPQAYAYYVHYCLTPPTRP
ncbi:hypothetical protein [Streptomyces sp. NPDC059874]|uniref:hypothetical protein n=1 Tax=Streptomyces sp. NPDC059874 TaxID=3346983 RepID=UPI0036680F7A